MGYNDSNDSSDMVASSNSGNNIFLYEFFLPIWNLILGFESLKISSFEFHTIFKIKFHVNTNKKNQD